MTTPQVFFWNVLGTKLYKPSERMYLCRPRASNPSPSACGVETIATRTANESISYPITRYLAIQSLHWITFWNPRTRELSKPKLQTRPDQDDDQWTRIHKGYRSYRTGTDPRWRQLSQVAWEWGTWFMNHVQYLIHVLQQSSRDTSEDNKPEVRVCECVCANSHTNWKYSFSRTLSLRTLFTIGRT